MRFVAVLRHRAGHSEKYHLSLPVDKSGAKNLTQGGGSTQQYAKRYLLTAILNIVAEGIDNDANSVVPINEDQRLTIETLVSDKHADLKRMLAWLGVPSIAEIPASRFREVVQKLERK